jgi:hypothetical protein
MNSEFRLLQVVTRIAPLLAPIPSAFFIARAIYFYLLLSWHLALPGWLNLTVAIVAGLAIELLAISSIYLATSLNRWNHLGRVRKANGWERAPFALALWTALAYFAVAIYLLVVLEAMPTLAPFSAVAFPMLAGVGAVTWALWQQHQDRLDRYGLQWTFKHHPIEAETEPAKAPTPALPLPPVYEPDEAETAIIVAMKQGAQSVSQVAAVTGMPRSTVGNKMLRLRQVGLIGGNNGTK